MLVFFAVVQGLVPVQHIASTLALANEARGAVSPQDDPMLNSLALGSVGLGVFVTGATVFITFQDQWSKPGNKDQNGRPKLPTMAELDTDTPVVEEKAPNRSERRARKRMKKRGGKVFP